MLQFQEPVNNQVLFWLIQLCNQISNPSLNNVKISTASSDIKTLVYIVSRSLFRSLKNCHTWSASRIDETGKTRPLIARNNAAKHWKDTERAFEPTLHFFIHWKACFAAAFPTHAAEGDVSKSLIASLANLGLPRRTGAATHCETHPSFRILQKITGGTFAIFPHSFSILPFQTERSSLSGCLQAPPLVSHEQSLGGLCCPVERQRCKHPTIQRMNKYA